MKEEKIVFLFEDGLRKEFKRNESIYGLKARGKRPVVYRTYGFIPNQRELYNYTLRLDPMWRR